MTVSDVAALLQTSQRGVYNRVHRRSIPHLKIGARIYFKPEEISAWVDGSDATVDSESHAANRVLAKLAADAVKQQHRSLDTAQQQFAAIQSEPAERPRLAVRVDHDVPDRLDRLSRANGRSELARRLLMNALEQLEEQSGVAQTFYIVTASVDGRVVSTQYRTRDEAMAVADLDPRRIISVRRQTTYQTSDGSTRSVDIDA